LKFQKEGCFATLFVIFNWCPAATYHKNSIAPLQPGDYYFSSLRLAGEITKMNKSFPVYRVFHLGSKGSNSLPDEMLK